MRGRQGEGAPGRARDMDWSLKLLPSLPTSICKLQEDEEVQQETLLHVNRAWDELNASIDFLRYRWDPA